MAPTSQFNKMIKMAIERQDHKIAGYIAGFCRFKMGMNYQEILERVQQVCPEVEMRDWDGLMYDHDEFLSRYDAQADGMIRAHVKEICY